MTEISIPKPELPKTKRANDHIGKKYLALRNQLWPDISDGDLWLRTEQDGFTTIPRTMPLIAEIINGMSKGKPAFSTYFDLWCRAFDQCFVLLNKKPEMAFYAGFKAERAEQTWKTRMVILAELGFIRIKGGSNGDLSYALILNPHKVIQDHHKRKTPTLTENHYLSLLARGVEIGAKDIGDVKPKPTN